MNPTAASGSKGDFHARKTWASVAAPVAWAAFLAGAGWDLRAVTTEYFNPSQVAVPVSSDPTSDTVRSGDYLFTHSLDKWWYPTISIGGGTPTGRFQSVLWPAGLHAQAVTAGPTGLLNPGSPAAITLKRADGAVFDVLSFSVKLLANTSGAGGSVEVMPLLNGNDGFPDPLALDASGQGGQTFHYTTPTLVGFDTYQMTLYVDFALVGVVVRDATPPPPVLSVQFLNPGLVRVA